MESNSKNKIIIFKNRDKTELTDSWYEGRDWMDFPHPSRILLSAKPGSGKTNIIKNILVKANPPYKRIYLYHYDRNTKEYDDVKHIKLSELPDPTNNNWFNPSIKSILIIDDHDFTDKKREEISKVDRLWGYTSTHKGLTIACATQDFFNLPVRIRRMSDIFIIWPNSSDFTSLYTIGKKMGLSKEEFKQYMDMCKTKYDSITFDFKPDTPAKIRFNFYTKLA